MSARGTPNSVIADVFDVQADYTEGFAAAELRPGMGCVIDESGDGTSVAAAGQNARTTRVVREPRNSPQGVTNSGGMDTSPLDATIAADGHTETVGFRRFQRARLRVASSSTAGVGDGVGWNSNGEISDVQTDGTTALTTFVGKVRKIVSDSSLANDIAVVEFY